MIVFTLQGDFRRGFDLLYAAYSLQREAASSNMEMNSFQQDPE